MPKRPIDRLRDSGKAFRVGSDGDDSPIAEMIPIGDRLYIVKERGIYAAQLADQIDPERSNPAIPDTVQKVLGIGSGNPMVAATLLTAHALLKKTFLGQSFDEARSMGLTLALLKDLVALEELNVDLETAEARAQASWEAEPSDQRALHLPAIGNVEARIHAFAQKAGHIVNVLEEVAKLFYPNDLTAKWIDSLHRIAKSRYGGNSPLCQYLNDAGPVLRFMLDMRNLIEHPKPDKCIVPHDYRMEASGQISPPRVDILRPGQATERATVTLLMRKVSADLLSVAEVLMAHLCAVNAKPFAGMPIQIVELSPERRRNPNVRFTYATIFNGQLTPIG